MADNETVLQFSTSGLGQVIKDFNDLAQSQKQLEQFLNVASKAFQTQGQTAQEASTSARQFADANNITAESFRALAEQQKQAKQTTDAINQAYKEQAKAVQDAAKASQDAAKAQESLNRANAALEVILKANQASIASVTNAFNGNSVAAKEAVTAFQQLQRSGADLENIEKQLAAQLGITAEQFDVISQHAKQSVESTNLLGGALQNVLQGIGQRVGYALISTLTQLPGNILAVNLEYEKLHTVLTTALGSQEASNAEFQKLRDFAATTPFQLDAITNSYIKLQNRGLDGSIEALTKLGDLAASQGKDIEQLTQAVVSATDGRTAQLKSFGIGAKLAGDQVTLSFKGLTETVKKSPEAIEAAILKFGELTGVAGGMEARSKTLGGAISNLEDNLKEIAVSFGEELIPALNEIIQGFNSSTPEIKEFAKTLGEDTAAVLNAFIGFVRDASDDTTELGKEVKIATESIEGFTDAISGIANVLVTSGSALNNFVSFISAGTLSIKNFAEAALQVFAPLLQFGKALDDDFAILNQDAVDKQTTAFYKLGDGTAALANHTKALNDSLKDNKNITQAQLDDAEKLVKSNQDQLAALQKRLEEEKKIPASGEAENNAKKATIAGTESLIKSLQGQTDALETTVKAQTKHTEATGLSKDAIKDEVTELKNKQRELKANAEAEERAEESATRRDQERQKFERATDEKNDEKQDAVQEQRKEKELKTQTENEIKEIKLKGEQEIADKKKEFERTVIHDVKVANELEIREAERQFNQEQTAEKKRTAQELKEDERQFNQEQSEEKKRTAKELKQDEKAFNKEINEEQKKVDLQLKLEDPNLSADQKAKLQKDLANEDVLAKRREQLEAPIEAKKEAFQAAQDAKRQKFEDAINDTRNKFEEQQNAKKQKFEDAINDSKAKWERDKLEPLKQAQQDDLNKKQSDFENKVIRPLKEGLEASTEKIKEANEAKIQKLKDAYEDNLEKRKFDFEEKERDIADKNAEAAEKRKAAFNQEQREKDEDSARKIEDIKRSAKTPQTTPDTSESDPTRIKQQIQGRREGGTVDAGTPYIVGEVEPELFVPNANGVILNREQARQNIAKLEQVGEIKYNPTPLNFNQVTNSNSAMLAELRELRSLVANRQAVQVPVTFTSNDDGYRALEQMMKLQFAMVRANL